MLGDYCTVLGAAPWDSPLFGSMNIPHIYFNDYSGISE